MKTNQQEEQREKRRKINQSHWTLGEANTVQRKTTEVDDRNTERALKKTPKTSPTTVKVSHNPLFKDHTQRCKPLVSKNQKARLQSKEKLWNTIVWTDEIKICLYRNGETKELLMSQSMVEVMACTATSGTGSLIFIAAVTNDDDGSRMNACTE